MGCGEFGFAPPIRRTRPSLGYSRAMEHRGDTERDLATPTAARIPGTANRTAACLIAGLCVAHLVVLAVLAAVAPATVDEFQNQTGAMALRADLRFEGFSQRMHGPLAYYGMQLASWFGVEFELPSPASAHNRFYGRLGMLSFALSASVLVGWLAWRVIGPRGAVAAVAMYTMSPLVIGHGGLMTADTALCAGTLLALIAADRYLAAPSLGRLGALGGALGIALATKYLAMLTVPALAIGLIGGTSLRSARARLFVRRDGLAAAALDLALVVAGCALVAWATLHACYLFRAGLYDAAAHPPAPGGTFDNVVSVPGGALLLGLLPEPFVRGIDYQMMAGRNFSHTMFLGEVVPGHWAYYLLGIAVTSPLPVFVLLALTAVRRGTPWPRRTIVLAGAVFAIPLLYLSLVARMQIGLRYVLPCIALLSVFAARAVDPLLGSRIGKTVLASLSVWLVVGAALHWPHYVGAFNPLAGSRPYELYGDSTMAWESAPNESPDLAALRVRHPNAAVLYHDSGPRFGTLIVHGLELWPRRASRSGPVRHWLRSIEPDDRAGTFYVFDVAPADLADDSDRAAALLGAGRLDEAAALAGATHVRPEVVAQLDRLRGSPGTADAIPGGWIELGRFDLVLADSTATPLERARAHAARLDHAACRDLVERERQQRKLGFREVQLLFGAQIGVGDMAAALATIDAVSISPSSPGYTLIQAERKRLRWLVEQNAALEATIRAGRQ